MDVKLIEHFIQIMGIEFYKAKTIEKGYIQANIKNIYDLLNASKTTFEKIDGIRNKSSEKIVESINKQINSVPVYTFAAALSIFPNMGVKKLELIFNRPDIISSIVEYYTTQTRTLYNQSLSRILNIGGFSKTSADLFIDNFPNFYELWEYIKNNYPNSKIAKYPEDIDVIDLSNDDNDDNPNSSYPELKNLEGLRIIFSGFRNSDLEKHIKKYNGHIADTLTKSASGIILVKDKEKSTSKTVKAQTLGYPVMTEEEFLQQYSI
jgi:NAD-dependent DNA ligase